MRLDSTNTVSLYRKRSRVLFGGQVALLLLLLVLGSALILITVEKGSFSTVLLFIFVSVGGLLLCRSTQTRLNDPSLKILGYFWLIKLGITFFLLYVGWIPLLDPSSGKWGYDPQRFYLQAQQLIDKNWSTAFATLISLNYAGVLYYYGAIFFVFGHNPVAPALVNVFITLIASMYLIKVGYEIKGQRGPRDWTLAFVLLLPEMLWYDVMTSREMLSAALLLFAMLTAGRYFSRIKPISLSKATIIIGLSMLVIAAVRTSMLLPVSISIVLMMLLIKSQRSSRIVKRATIAIAVTALFIVGPVITKYMGGYNFDVGQSLQTAMSASKNIALTENMGWSDNSIGKLLMPESLFSSILFLPPRMVLYLLAPLPSILVPVEDLLAGDWYAWQRLLTLFSSVINVFLIPYALASLFRSIKMRETNSAPLVFHISYWVTFLSIAGGNLIIHERYRVMATFLLWGCAWLGARTCSRRLIVRTSLFWYGFLILGSLFYAVYKFGIV